MGAKMVEFNGWDMPVEYPASIGCGIINEHMAVRTGVGIFDVSHMGDIRLAGPQALAAVQHISMNDASRLAVGQAQYSALLYPAGNVCRRRDRPPPRRGRISSGHQCRDAREGFQLGARQHAPVRLRGRESVGRLHADCDSGAEGGESAAEADRRGSERGEVLLGDARQACAVCPIF